MSLIFFAVSTPYFFSLLSVSFSCHSSAISLSLSSSVFSFSFSLLLLYPLSVCMSLSLSLGPVCVLLFPVFSASAPVLFWCVFCYLHTFLVTYVYVICWGFRASLSLSLDSVALHLSSLCLSFVSVILWCLVFPDFFLFACLLHCFFSSFLSSSSLASSVLFFLFLFLLILSCCFLYCCFISVTVSLALSRSVAISFGPVCLGCLSQPSTDTQRAVPQATATHPQQREQRNCLTTSFLYISSARSSSLCGCESNN